MAFPQNFLDELIARNPIEEVVGQYVSLRRSGSNLFGLCPFHGEKTASFSVAPEKGIYYCFGCHKGGNAINFTMEIEGLSYPDAVRKLAEKSGMEVPEDEVYKNRYRKQERLYALLKEAARYYNAMLFTPAGKPCLDYALGRGMTKAAITNFGLGFAPDSWDGVIKHLRGKGYTDGEMQEAGMVSVSQKSGNIYDRFRNRFMFPIIDVRGNVIGFGGRVLDDSKPKYLNTPETSVFNKRKNLFGLNLAKKTKLPYMILVEGNVDVVSLHQFGFDNAVASLGTSLTDEHAALLRRYTEQVCLIYDGDAAGQDATRRAIPMLEKVGIQVRVLQVQGAKDPDEFLQKFGADRFRLMLEGSADRVEYQLTAMSKKYDLTVTEQKVAFLQEAAQLLATLSSPIKREIYLAKIAEVSGVSAETIRLETERIFKKNLRQEKKKQEKISLDPMRALQPKERSLHYNNVKSAVAEERIIAQLVQEPNLFDMARELEPGDFTVPLFGKVFESFRELFRKGLTVSPAMLEGLTPEENAHLAKVCFSQTGTVNEQAFRDCVAAVLQKPAKVESDDDLLALQNKLKERKGK